MSKYLKQLETMYMYGVLTATCIQKLSKSLGRRRIKTHLKRMANGYNSSWDQVISAFK